MNIVQINASFGYGSTGRMNMEVADYINQNTEHVCYSAFAQGKEDEFSFRIGNYFEWKIHALLSRICGKQGYYSINGTRRFLQRLDAIQPDVICLGNLHGNYINLPLLFKYVINKKIPVVFVLHDCWFFTGRCCHYTVQGCYKWLSGCYDCPTLNKYNVSWFADKSKDLWNDKRTFYEQLSNFAVIGVSDWILGEAKKSILGNADELCRIYNWIDIELFKPIEASRDSILPRLCVGKRIVLGVAPFWDEDKGLSRFISLAQLLDDRYVIVLVGSIDTKLPLPQNIVHVDRTDSINKLVEFYNCADVFVTMSFEESFGKVSAEALSCGTPVICFDSTANKELVGEGCGVVIEKGNIVKMKDAINKVTDYGKNYYKYKCRQFAEDNFSKDQQIDKYLKLFIRTSENKQKTEG